MSLQTGNHIAGDPNEAEMVQRCVVCGQMLQDYQNAMGEGNWSPAWWAPGKPVAVRVLSCRTDYSAHYDDDLPDCADLL